MAAPPAPHRRRTRPASEPWLNAVTHPELLAVASLLLAARERDIDAERGAPYRLGFSYQPYPGEPLALSLLNPRKKATKSRQMVRSDVYYDN